MTPARSPGSSTRFSRRLRRWLALIVVGGGLASPSRAGGGADTPAGGGRGEGSTAGHWAFRPVVRPALPSTGSSDWARNPVDAFVLDRLRRAGLAPSPEAPKRLLIRRLYFDVLGLPPTPEEVEAFVAAPGEGVYLDLVEKVLASPHYGERWARHWLDVVRFAETHGFEMNQPRPNAWPYRDYVIRAFNEDRPYDRFILEQLAGDLLGVDEATGFLVAGAWDQVKSPDVVLTSNQRADELHDMVSTTGTAFLGVTLGCARCHDHKFDPIPQRDYYAVKAVFAGVQHGERPIRGADPETRRRDTREHQLEIERLDRELAAIGTTDPPAIPATATLPGAEVDRQPLLRGPVQARENEERFEPMVARRLRFTISATTGGEPCLDELEVYAGGTEIRNVALAAAGTRVTASGTFAGNPLHRLEHLNDGRYGNGRSWISDAPGRGWVELEFAAPETIHRIVWGRDREGQFADRLATQYRIEVQGDAGDWQTVASSDNRLPPFGDRLPATLLERVANRSPDLADRLERLWRERESRAARLRELGSDPMSYAGVFGEPEPTRRLHRGDPLQPREEVAAGALTGVGMARGLEGDGGEPGKGKEAARRLALARWIASRDNPLTARVMVNRLWQHHFGEGLVATPSDFGANGALPSHPELLDWLAVELMTRGWSLKQLHRLILTSSTYRQSSAWRPDGHAADADSRWLWRFPPRRLEAEPIRDTILAVSGSLDPRLGGPGWSAFEPNENYVRVYQPRAEFGPAEFRRMVYATTVRQRPEGVFGVFDCPDGGQVAPRRNRSTTPLQALNLLNSGFLLQQAGFFAERLEREAGPKPNDQVSRAFALAFGRPPTAEEVRVGADFISRHGLRWFGRAILNANEFLYVF